MLYLARSVPLYLMTSSGSSSLQCWSSCGMQREIHVLMECACGSRYETCATQITNLLSPQPKLKEGGLAGRGIGSRLQDRHWTMFCARSRQPGLSRGH